MPQYLDDSQKPQDLINENKDKTIYFKDGHLHFTGAGEITAEGTSELHITSYWDESVPQERVFKLTPNQKAEILELMQHKPSSKLMDYGISFEEIFAKLTELGAGEA